MAQLVAARTGLSQPDAEKRVDQVIAEAKVAADKARRGAVHLSFWLTAALLLRAFAASLACCRRLRTSRRHMERPACSRPARSKGAYHGYGYFFGLVGVILHAQFWH